MQAREGLALRDRFKIPVAALLIGAFVAVGASLAQSVGPTQMPPARAAQTSAAPRLPLAEALNAAALEVLPPATAGAAERLASLQAWNAAHRLPVMAGFTRDLLAPTAVRLEGSAASAASAATGPRPFARGLLAGAGAGQLAWGTHVRVEGAYRLRLHLADVHLPAGTRMWVAAKGSAPRGFGLELVAPSGDLWTPSVKGESLLFEIHVPAGSAEARFTLRGVMELVRLDVHATAAGAAARSAAGTSCAVDSSCVGDGVLPNIQLYRHAMAQLSFVEGGGAYLCSGGLLNDSAGDLVPYLLTAHHCFADQDAAASLEARFDYYTSSCGGPAPVEGTEPMANGSTLLASKAASDFTFVRLDNVPAGRTFLGWNADAGALQQGTALYRLSFPVISWPVSPEMFSQGSLQTGSQVAVCTAVPPPNFLYETLVQGATFPGSSGSPVLLGNGQVVGQLTGGCGPDPWNPCDYANADVDGAFAVTFPWVAGWLSPSSTCYALSLSHSGSGSDPIPSPLASDGCASGMFRAGTAIGLTAAPAAGSAVTGWSGTDDVSASPSNALTMPAMDYAVGVSYAPCYLLSLSHTGSGSDPVASPPSSAGCAPGRYLIGSVQLTASPAPGWVVAGWTGTFYDPGPPAEAHYAGVGYGDHAVSVAYQPSGFYTLTPCRLLDTRGPSGEIGAAFQPFERRHYIFFPPGGCGQPASATALSLNVTVTDPTAPGFLRLFSPLLASAPITSNINFGTGQTRANNAIVGVYYYGLMVQNDSAGTVQVIVDVNGYFQ
jgi:hypothetical protein